MKTLIEKAEQMLSEESSSVDAYEVLSDYPVARGLIGKVSSALDYDLYGAFSFCLHLLEDVNAHKEMAELQPIMQKWIDNFEKFSTSE